MKEFHSRYCIRRQVAILMALLVICISQVEASPSSKTRRHLSRPEKVWSAFHPFKAKKVLKCARRSIFVTDSLEKAGVLTDRDGGQLDAFRHAYWMALMIKEGMNKTVVRKIGERHEKGNYIDFKRGRLEDSSRADSMMCVMDLRNNERGIETGELYTSDSPPKLSMIEMVLLHIWNGTMVIMSKNAAGEYLDKDGTVIKMDEYKGKWYIPKVIVNSNMIVVPH